jgi:hypothetical protein
MNGIIFLKSLSQKDTSTAYEYNSFALENNSKFMANCYTHKV